MLRTFGAFLVAALMLSGCFRNDEHFAQEYAKIRDNVGIIIIRHSGFFMVAPDPAEDNQEESGSSPSLYPYFYITTGKAGAVIYEKGVFVLSAGHLFVPLQELVEKRKNELAEVFEVPPERITRSPDHKEAIFVEWSVRGNIYPLELIAHESFDIRKKKELLEKADFALLRLPKDDEKTFAPHAFELGSTKNLKPGDILWVAGVVSRHPNNRTIPVQFLEPLGRPFAFSEDVNTNEFSYYGPMGQGLSGTVILKYGAGSFKVIGVFASYSPAYDGALFGYLAHGTKSEVIIAELDKLIAEEEKTKKQKQEGVKNEKTP